MIKDSLSDPSLTSVQPAGVTIRGNRDPLWRFVAFGVLIVVVSFLMLGESDGMLKDLMIVAIALVLLAIPIFGVAVLLTMRMVVTPERLELHGITFHDRIIERGDLDRIHAERRATLTRGGLGTKLRLYVTLSGQNPSGDAIELRLNSTTLDTARMLAALAPWIEARSTLVQDDATREVLASLDTT